MACQCTVTQGREGPDRSSWCVDCGKRVLAVHDRPCGECASYEPQEDWNGPHPRVGFCRNKAHPMRITAGNHVSYYVEPGPHRHGLCFETNPVQTGSKIVQEPKPLGQLSQKTQ